MGRAERWRSRSRGCLGQASLAACGSVRWLKVWRGGGWILRDGRAHKRSRVQPARSEASEVLSRLGNFLSGWNGRKQKSERERLQKRCDHRESSKMAARRERSSRQRIKNGKLVNERKFAYRGRQNMKRKIAYSYLSFVSKTVPQIRNSKRLIESAKRWCADQNLDFKPCGYDALGLEKGRSAYSKSSESGLRLFLRGIKERKIQPGSVLILEDLPDYQAAPPLQTFRDASEIIAQGVDVVTLADAKRHEKASLSDPINLIWSLAIVWHRGEIRAMNSQRAKAVASFHRSKAKATIQL